jgi:hypothetical protein
VIRSFAKETRIHISRSRREIMGVTGFIALPLTNCEALFRPKRAKKFLPSPGQFLEARGVEPLSSSLSTQTSTCLSGI